MYIECPMQKIFLPQNFLYLTLKVVYEKAERVFDNADLLIALTPKLHKNVIYQVCSSVRQVNINK
jgi:hypothetical protein